MKIESKKAQIQASPQEVFSFLMNLQNLIHILPKDQLSDFKASEDECSFKVQGGVIISLVKIGHEDQSKIFLKSGEKSPFPFTLTINMSENQGGTSGYLLFDGEVNMFLKMMVERPLTNLFNYMSNELENQFNK